MRRIVELCLATLIAATFGCSGSKKAVLADDAGPSANRGGAGTTAGGPRDAGAGGTGASGRSGAGTSGRAASVGGGGAGRTSSADASSGVGGGGGKAMTGTDAGSTSDDAAIPALHGGSSAAYVCHPGASYGNPLTGLGTPTAIHPPQGGQFSFIEGPVWFSALHTLFFSDNASSPAERIWKLVPPSTSPSIFKDNAGANGMAIDDDDRLVVCNQGARTVTRVDPATGNETTIASTYMGKKFNSPNDVIVHSNGTIYFSDPPHGLKGRTAEMGFNGIFRISTAGEVTLVETWMSRDPNGIVLSADERTLFVSEDNAAKVWKLALDPDGTVQGASSLFVTTSTTPDGMAVDCAGNLYVATSNGIEVFDPAGTKLGTIPQKGSNCTFGGDDRQTLYITSSDTLYSIHLNVPGLPD